MGLLENFKIKRAAKKAQAVYQLALNEWEQENRVLNAALDIFTTASKGDEPDDSSLVQKKGELVLWTGKLFIMRQVEQLPPMLAAHQVFLFH